MISRYTVQDLKNFELEVAEIFNSGKIKAPVHLSDGNESYLIEVFKNIKDADWVICSWRSHYQCLLKGVSPNDLMEEIKAGRSISLSFPDYRIFSSAIVGGQIPIAVGLALAEKRKKSDRHVWCFIGDMTSETGIAATSIRYAEQYDLPITFVIEDNGLSVLTDTRKVWNTNELTYEKSNSSKIMSFKYKSSFPHAGAGVRVQF
jgi:TPP-dependent pyruvate/acetoin dehydrogenase alpha subunit